MADAFSRCRYRKGNHALPGRVPHAPEAITAQRICAGREWPVHHWNIRLRDRAVVGKAEGGDIIRGREQGRIAGFRVVMSWPQSGFAPQPRPRGSLRARLAGIAGALLIVAGAAAVGVVVTAQVHAPRAPRAAAGDTGPSGQNGRSSLPRSLPVAVAIPAIGVRAALLHLGVNPDGTIAVPSLNTQAGLAAWYRYSVTPGQIGASVIEGHVDTYHGPAVFFRLGALRPGDRIDVTLADGTTAVFRVTGVRLYLKASFPAKAVYGAAGFAALHLITCGGVFDDATGHYLSSTVVFASLTSARPPAGRRSGG